MELEELRKYNQLVIDSAKEVAKPWKWATSILAILLGLMVALYFLYPASVDVDQIFNGQKSIGTTNNQKG